MLDRRRQVVDDRVEQSVGGEVAGRDPARDREQRAVVGAVLERGHDLLVRDLIAFQVPLHQRVGGLGDLVHQLLPVFLGPLQLGRRYLDLGAVLASGAVVGVGLHVDEVDHASDVVLGADRDLGRDDVLTERGLQRLERAEEVGPLAIEHVDEQEPRQVKFSGALPEPVGVDLDAHHGVDDEHGRLADPERAQRIGDEAGVPRRVEQVHLAVEPLKRGQRQRDRHLAGLLIGVGIGHRGAVDDRAEPVGHPGLKQDRLVQGRLTGAAVADEGHVADPIRGLVHAQLLSLG